MRSPIQFETSLCPHDVRPIEAHKHLLRYLMVGELDEAVPDWSAFELVPDKFDRLDRCDVLEERRDVSFIHPWFNIANPESFSAHLGRLLVRKAVLCH